MSDDMVIPAVEGRDPLLRTTPARFRASVERSLSATRALVLAAVEHRRDAPANDRSSEVPDA